LCVDILNRRVGSQGNREATAFFAELVTSFGFEAESTGFDCIDWHQDGVDLGAAGETFKAFASPYSLGCQVSGPLQVAGSVEALETAELAGGILLMRGELTKEQLMPKRFPFYNPDHHKRIIGLLEAKQPRAIITATARDLEMVGGLYPFPLFEDGDFDIPSIYLTDVEGERLASYAGQTVALESRAKRLPATGENVVARKGVDLMRRVVLFAHIDTRMGTPGANDNASGVIALMLLAELLADYPGELGIELVAMNGEDYYANPGEQLYLAANADRFDEIVLGINLDDIAYIKGKIAYSLYGCPTELADLIHGTFVAYEGLIEGEPWYAGDHGLFLINQIPAAAVTSELLEELMVSITHTPKDSPDIVDVSKIVLVATAVRDLLLRLDEAPT
jgi:aminopeptidase YwaD